MVEAGGHKVTSIARLGSALGLVALVGFSLWLFLLYSNIMEFPAAALLVIIGFLGVAYALILPPALLGKSRLPSYSELDFNLLTGSQKFEYVLALFLRGLVRISIFLAYLGLVVNGFAVLEEWFA